ncbi:hypothetical protein [Amycolatopsis sp. NPDC004625]|uniref:hypothetical protein n=1 Tax=Amycolatopsis sp. NPDC004625 TaxID=3154670 RepID=UPI0033AD05CD
MAGHRRVVVRAQHREVLGDPATGELLTCPGIDLTFYAYGRQVGDVWVPAGDQPDAADDELLIEALHRAVCWDEDHQLAAGPGSRNAMISPAT